MPQHVAGRDKAPAATGSSTCPRRPGGSGGSIDPPLAYHTPLYLCFKYNIIFTCPQYTNPCHTGTGAGRQGQGGWWVGSWISGLPVKLVTKIRS